MSYHLTLHSWTGSDPTAEGEKLAKVFRLDPPEGIRIVQDLQAGKIWVFDQTISNEQADLALNYLSRLGFEVDLEPALPQSIPPVAPVAQENEAHDFLNKIEESSPVLQKESGESFSFSGMGGELFKIFIKNVIFIIGTLGVYKFWAKTNVRRYLWDHTLLHGDSFRYHGTGMELLRGNIRLIGFILFVSLGMGAAVYMDLADEEVVDTVTSVLNLLIVILIPAFMVGSRRYLLSRSSWRSVHFSFRGYRKEAIGLYVKGWLLSIITLGFYWPYFLIQKEVFWRGNSFFGDKRIDFDGVAKDILKTYFLMGLFILPTLGLYYFWYKARLQSYFWSHTHFEGASFHFTATGGEWLKLSLVNLLLLIFSFGFAFPWVTTRTMKFKTKHLFIEGHANFDLVVQQMQDSGAFGDVALDAMDVDMDIG